MAGSRVAVSISAPKPCLSGCWDPTPLQEAPSLSRPDIRGMWGWGLDHPGSTSVWNQNNAWCLIGATSLTFLLHLAGSSLCLEVFVALAKAAWSQAMETESWFYKISGCKKFYLEKRPGHTKQWKDLSDLSLSWSLFPLLVGLQNGTLIGTLERNLVVFLFWGGASLGQLFAFVCAIFFAVHAIIYMIFWYENILCFK